MFKKGCFELGATIYPAVIKVLWTTASNGLVGGWVCVDIDIYVDSVLSSN